MKIILYALVSFIAAMFAWPQTTLSTSMAVVTVTAYNHCRPGITSSGQHVREGIIALSNDLENRLGMKFGEKVHLEGLGAYEFQDRMARRMRNTADVFMNCRKQALKFGVRRNVLLVKVV